MRSLPQPRYSRIRTIKRIFRSMVNLFSTGYISDSSAFAHRSVLDKSSHKTKIRTSRITGKPTPRSTMVNKISMKLVSGLITDETLIGNIVRNEMGGLLGETIVNDINHSSKRSLFSFWKSGERMELNL